VHSVAAAAVLLFAFASGGLEYGRRRLDELDRASMAAPRTAARLQTMPTVGESGLVYSLLDRDGYSLFHPSAFGRSLAYEANNDVAIVLPDGRRASGKGLTEPAMGAGSVVAIRETPDGAALMEFSADGEWREILRRSSVVHDPAIASDGSRIAFSELHEGRYSIWEWDRETGETRLLLHGAADYRHPAYDPLGGRLAFSTNEKGDWDIARLTIDGGAVETLTRSAGNDLMPAFSPDGRSLFFASDRRRGHRYTAIYMIALAR
jgi:hypothetical protein